jgi:hypothetical protein
VEVDYDNEWLKLKNKLCGSIRTISCNIAS